MKHITLSVVTALTFVVFTAPGAFPDTITWTDTQYEAVTDSFSGAENIYVARTDLPPTFIPEASAVFLFGIGLAGLVANRRKRRMA
jgi:hypothetical protein